MNFLWGASTSSHQIEGGLQNNWTEWEKENSHKLAQNSDRNFSWVPNWHINKDYAVLEENYISGDRINHRKNYIHDVELIKKLGLNAYRFSLEWSMIEPQKGIYSIEGIDFYKKLIKELKKNGIEPIVTIWHWTIPLWLVEEGGWESKDFPHYFEGLTRFIVSEIGIDIKYWVTINEPNVVNSLSLGKGEWPPQKRSVISLIRGTFRLISAHKKSYRVIKDKYPNSSVSIAKNLVHYDDPGLVKKIGRYITNDFFINRTKQHLDYLGINHYFTSSNKLSDRNKYPQSDLGWSISPQFFGELLTQSYERYNLPIFILENGLADREDHQRPTFIKEIFKQINISLQNDIPIIGYCHWSLMDNFEWDKGYWPKFGLIEIDKNGIRTIRKSGLLYRDLIKEFNSNHNFAKEI
jgi:beta-glucosidase